MKWMVLIWIAVAAGLQAQNSACPSKLVPASTMVEIRDRSVLEPISGITLQDLLLRGKGIEGPPLGIASALPADIVVLIEDRSRGGLIAGAADLFVKSLHPEDRVAVMTYGVSSKRQLAWTQDKESIRLAMEKGADGLSLQIARPFYGVVDALKLFDKPAPGRLRAIFMLGDDLDNGSQIRMEQLAANLIEERVVLDLAIDPAPRRFIPRVNVPPPTVGNDSPATRPALVGQQSVVALAETTGGNAEKYVKAEFFEAMRQRLGQRISVTYCIEKKHADRLPSIDLTETAKQKWPNVEVRFPGRR